VAQSIQAPSTAQAGATRFRSSRTRRVSVCSTRPDAAHSMIPVTFVRMLHQSYRDHQKRDGPVAGKTVSSGSPADGGHCLADGGHCLADGGHTGGSWPPRSSAIPEDVRQVPAPSVPANRRSGPAKVTCFARRNILPQSSPAGRRPARFLRRARYGRSGPGKATCFARMKTSSSMAWVTRPVNVFCWLGW